MKLTKEKSSRLCIILLGTIFITSGVLKSINIYSFAQEVREYLDIYLLGFLSDYALVCAIILCSVEITIGLWSFRRPYRHAFCIIAFFLLAFFATITCINWLVPSVFGSIESCGCFGELIHFSPFASFVKSTVLLCIVVIVLATNYKKIITESIMNIFYKEYTYISLVLGSILPIYSLLAFNNLNHVTYILGGASILVIIYVCSLYNIKKVHSDKK